MRRVLRPMLLLVTAAIIFFIVLHYTSASVSDVSQAEHAHSFSAEIEELYKAQGDETSVTAMGCVLRIERTFSEQCSTRFKVGTVATQFNFHNLRSVWSDGDSTRSIIWFDFRSPQVANRFDDGDPSEPDSRGLFDQATYCIDGSLAPASTLQKTRFSLPIVAGEVKTADLAQSIDSYRKSYCQ